MHHFKNSSSLAHVDHDGECLIIKFQSGKTYRYLDCGQEHLDGLKNAESPGKYFFANVRGKYKHEVME